MNQNVLLMRKERNECTPIHCHLCGGWVCDLAMERGIIVQKCQRCHRKIVIIVKEKMPCILLDRRCKQAA